MPIALLDRPLRWLVPVLCGVLLNGCASLDYYAQVSRGQLDLLAARQPVVPDLRAHAHGTGRELFGLFRRHAATAEAGASPLLA